MSRSIAQQRRHRRACVQNYPFANNITANAAVCGAWICGIPVRCAQRHASHTRRDQRARIASYYTIIERRTRASCARVCTNEHTEIALISSRRPRHHPIVVCVYNFRAACVDRNRLEHICVCAAVFERVSSASLSSSSSCVQWQWHQAKTVIISSAQARTHVRAIKRTAASV